MTVVLHYQSQGQQIAPGWDNTAGLRDWVALFGTDSERFPPPNDRNGYTDGVERPLNTGAIFMAGIPVDRLTFPWLSDGQIRYLHDTINGGSESGNVTVKIHTPLSVGRLDVYTYNAVMNLNLGQTANLTRRRNGFKLFVVSFVLVEPL
jgi:hypothetical protein